MEFLRDNIIPGEVIVQLLAFLVVFTVLKLFAWQPVLNALEARRERIRSQFAQIEVSKKEIESLKTEYHAHLQKIEDEARAKIQEAIEEGRRIGREIQEKARKESQGTLEKAKENIEIELAKARIELRREIAGLALNVTERILQEKLSDAAAQEAKALAILSELERAL